MWGREHEKDGIQLYKNMLAGSGSNEYLINDEPIIIHENLEVVPLGLCVLQPKLWYGASPDSAVFFTCCGYGVVEVKCPYSLRDKSVREEVFQNRFYIGHSANGYLLQRKHNYYFQVQHEMSVTGTTYYDFIVWTPTESVIFNICYLQEFFFCS